jgi:hypothetical protein
VCRHYYCNTHIERRRRIESKILEQYAGKTVEDMKADEEKGWVSADILKLAMARENEDV